MRHLLPLLGLLLAALPPVMLPGPAWAALTEAQLAEVELAPPPGARLPPDLPLRDEDGHAVTPAALQHGLPAVLVLADYTCVTLCGPALGIAAHALAETGLRPGRDVVSLAIALGPRDGPAEARAMKAAHLDGLPPALLAATHVLTGPAAALDQVQSALGYRAQFDEAVGRYAHPIGILVLTGDGRVSRLLDGLAPDPAVLRLALVEASDGRIGTLGDRLHLLCYGLDPAHGIYNGMVKQALTVGTLLTLGGLGLFLVLVSRRRAQGGQAQSGQAQGGQAQSGQAQGGMRP
ncbi:MAG: SCO family protein [Azospirillum brasilense]|nr:MAG: SCO family protein [Azospirillum brasilense]